MSKDGVEGFEPEGFNEPPHHFAYLSTIYISATGSKFPFCVSHCDKPGSPLPGVETSQSSSAFSSAEPVVVDHSVINQVCMLYFFGAWGKRMWEFAGIVFIMEIFPGSLLASSVFGLMETVIGMLWSPAVGRFIDNNQRLHSIRTSVLGQNAAVVFASGVLAFALAHHAEHWGHPAGRLVVLGLLIGATGVAKLAASLNRISLQKDWAVVISKQMTEGRRLLPNQTAPLTIFNARMHRVDLTCSIMAPLMVGAASSWGSPFAAVVVVGIWSSLSTGVEMFLTQHVYKKISALWHKEGKAPAVPLANDGKAPNEDSDSSTVGSLRAYISHPVFLAASLPYCLLYISVLSFGGIMTSFLRTVGCPDVALAGGRGAGALFAIGGTIVTPAMMRTFARKSNRSADEITAAEEEVGDDSRRRAALIKAALIMLWWQICSLLPLAVGFLLFSSRFQELSDDGADSPAFLPFMTSVFVSLCFSRLGLWGFDLAQTQLMQESVDIREAGTINGAQQTLMEACFIMSFVMTIAFPSPSTFFIPAFLSFACILAAAILFTLFRHQLLHKGSSS